MHIFIYYSDIPNNIDMYLSYLIIVCIYFDFISIVWFNSFIIAEKYDQ